MTKKIIAPIITLAFIVVFAVVLYFLNRPPALLEEARSEPMDIHFVLGAGKRYATYIICFWIIR